MPSTVLSPAGFFGKIPAAADFVSWNLPRAFTDRWDRWMSRDLLDHPSRGPLDPRAWRFIVPAGIFCDQPAAGVWRMSEDRAGRRYPFVIARLGPVPDPGTLWFEALANALNDVVERYFDQAWLTDRLNHLEAAEGAPGYQGRIRFWLDDWEVQEFEFDDVYDLAQTGLSRMRSPRAKTTA